jgi:fatty acid amide hydrolase
MARRVEDIELAMRILAATPRVADDYETSTAPWPMPDGTDVRGLRIALWLGDDFVAPSQAIVRVLHEAAAALIEAGAIVEPLTFIDTGEAIRLYIALVGADGGRDLARLAVGSEIDPRIARMIRLARLPRWLRPLGAQWLRLRGQRKLADLFLHAGARSAHEYWDLTHRAAEFTRKFLAKFAAQKFDAILSPPHTLAAVRHLDADADLLPAAGHAFLMNLLGVPCGVVARGFVTPDDVAVERSVNDALTGRCRRNERGSAGLPVGVQVAAPHGRDDLVLRLMRFLETPGASPSP